MAQPTASRRRFVRRTTTMPALTVVPETPLQTGRPWTGARDVKLSVLMPAFNEERTIERAVRVVLATRFPCDMELIIVNDGSKDATAELLDAIGDPRARVHHHPRNLGKGAALQTAAALATGTHIVPFDADLEYEPGDVARMLDPIIAGRCDIVYGTRLFGANTVYQSYRHAMGNRALTLAANLLFDSYLSDLHTCLKMVPLALFRDLDLKESGFGLDTEITAKILKLGVRPFEVPVSYHSRSAAMGKKITWVDGVECLQVLSRIRFGKATVSMPVGTVAARSTRPVAAPSERESVGKAAAG
jgi:glycosyltransferase involved in cell wall biosynthesis